MGNINLLVAKFENEIINYSEYNKSVHHGKIYCPSCAPVLRVTDSGKGYFMAWKNEGGHNCGIGEVKYLDADWIGRKLVENIKVDKQLEVNIDVDLLFRRDNNITPGDKTYGNTEGSKEKAYYTYHEKKEIFRDVIRSVLQMKKIIEQNPYDKLQNIDFYFKFADKERLKLDEAVISSSDLNRNKHQFKYRFILFKVDKIIKKKNKIYINAYKANENSLSIFMNLNDGNTKINIAKNAYAIVFGKITFSSNYNKYFVEITNDFQIKEINENKIEPWFKGVELAKFDYSDIKDARNIDNQVLIEHEQREAQINETKNSYDLKVRNISNSNHVRYKTSDNITLDNKTPDNKEPDNKALSNKTPDNKTLDNAPGQGSSYHRVEQLANKKNIEISNKKEKQTNRGNNIFKKILNRFSKK